MIINWKNDLYGAAVCPFEDKALQRDQKLNPLAWGYPYID